MLEWLYCCGGGPRKTEGTEPLTFPHEGFTKYAKKCEGKNMAENAEVGRVPDKVPDLNDHSTLSPHKAPASIHTDTITTHVTSTSTVPLDRFESDETLTASATFKKAGREHWEAFGSVNHCIKCERDFGITLWKFHCRACGRIFCWKCVKWEVNYTPPSRKNEEGYKEKKKKVCEACFDIITEAQAKGETPKIDAIPRSISKSTPPGSVIQTPR